MRSTLALALFAGLVLTATGQVPPADKKKAAAPAKGADAPAAKVPEAAPAAMAPPAGTYPSEIGGKNLEQWIRDIDNPDPSVRVTAIRTVINFGPGSKKAIPAVIRQLAKIDNDYSPRANAILILPALVSLDPQTYSKQAVDALSVALDSTQGIMRVEAAEALEKLGPAARVTVPKLVKLVEDRSSWEIRRAAASALGAIARDEQGWPDMRGLNALMLRLEDISKEVRMECLQSIINLGPPASGEISAYKNLLEKRLKADKDKATQIWIRVALMRLDVNLITDTNLSTIAKMMKGQEIDIRIQAARALGYVGTFAKSQIPALIDALKDDAPLMVWQVCWSLMRMEKDGEKAINALQAIADNHTDPQVRAAAEFAIKEIKESIKKPPEKPAEKK